MTDRETRDKILEVLAERPGIRLQELADRVIGYRTDYREVGRIGAVLTRMQLEGRTENMGEGFAIKASPKRAERR